MSQDLIEQYQQLHRNETFGISGNLFRPHIQALIHELRPRTIVNFGCGSTKLHEELQLQDAVFHRYDPAIAELSVLPVTSADLVINTDVLEHIPRSELDSVLAQIRALSAKVFFNIATRPARQLLPDGSNAHCTILPAAEWQSILARHFPQTELVWDIPGWACSFVTWPSSSLEILRELERSATLRRFHKKRALRLFTRFKGRQWKGWTELMR